jgi:aryl-alcohol dehydrogenase-like predicted oxidoreductase
MLGRVEQIVPIPGTRSIARLEENAAASNIVLSEGELALLEQIAPREVASGTRYPEAGMQTVGR